VDKAVYYCQRCKATGPLQEEQLENLNVIDIKEKLPFNPKVFQELEPLNEDCYRYLHTRLPGIESDRLDQFNLRYHSRYHAIAIPTYHPTLKTIQGIKYRLIAPLDPVTRFFAVNGSVFGGYWLHGSSPKLLIVEGELDAITAKVCGFQGSVLALQTNRLSEESVKKVRAFKNIFLALDNDEAGIQGAESIKAILGNYRVPVSIQMPSDTKDLNEMLQKDGRYVTENFIKEQTKTEVEKKTVTASSRQSNIVEFLKNKEAIKGKSTGWASLDRIFAGGLRPKEFTVLNGFFKRGKTTVLTNLTFNMALNGVRCAISSFEMDGDTQLFPNYLSLALGSDVTQLPIERVDSTIKGLLQDLPELNNIAIFNNYGKTTRAEVEEWLRHIAKEGYEVVVLDHSGFMLEEPGNANENEKLAEMLASLAKELNIHLICVVQSPKPSKDRTGSYVMELSGLTAHGGTSWAKYCSNFLTLSVDFDSAVTKLALKEAGRNRWTIRDEEVWLSYERETGRLVE
jgi:KaiC/GvpD/RAD55 family RecA-like ATPase